MHVSPSISVIVPCFNAASTVAETLNSVMGQTLLPYEVIAVNDGSSDDTFDVIEAYASSAPKVPVRVINQENKGVSAARNAGVAIARGELVCFLDADDLWHPNKLEFQLRALRSADPDNQAIAVVGVRRFTVDPATGCKNFFRDTRPVFDPRMGRSERIKMVLALSNNEMAATSTVLCPRSSFLDVGGWDESLKMAEDWDLLCRLGEVLPMTSEKEPLLLYRKHALSVTARYVDYSALQRQQFRMLNKYARRSKISGEARRQLISRHLKEFLGLCALGSGLKSRGVQVKLIILLLIYDPSVVLSKNFYRYVKRCVL